MKRTLLKNLKENEETKISGFIERIRDTKYMLFVIVKDRTGFIQVSLDKNNKFFFKKQAMNYKELSKIIIKK